MAWHLVLQYTWAIHESPSPVGIGNNDAARVQVGLLEELASICCTWQNTSMADNLILFPLLAVTLQPCRREYRMSIQQAVTINSSYKIAAPSLFKAMAALSKRYKACVHCSCLILVQV